jgi:hypothetical protein
VWGRRPCLEDDRDRPVVDERNLHPRAEHALRDRDAFVSQGGAEAFVERLGLLRSPGIREARAVHERREVQERP